MHCVIDDILHIPDYINGHAFTVINLFKYLFLFSVYEGIDCCHVYVAQVCLMHAGGKGRHQLIWSWSYRSLLAIMWVLRTDSVLSKRTKHA